jgi:host factor-I protein
MLQRWIRQKQILRMQLVDGSIIQGRICWQDPEFLAMHTLATNDLELVRRSMVMRISALA